jgi:hypothetical protein
MKNWKGYVLVILNFIFFVFSIGALMWGITVAFVCIVLCIYSLYLTLRSRNNKRALSVFIINGLIFLITIPYSNKQYDRKSDSYYNIVLSGDELSFIEKLNVYNLNILISAVSFPVYPEIGMESFLLIFPDNDKQRTFKSDFFLKSDLIQKAIAQNDKFVTWSGKYYLNFKEARVALALNPCILKWEVNGSKISYMAKVKVRYPENSKTLLVNYPIKFYIQEGLFNYLQKEGWLHPYTAIWYSDK